MTALPEAADCPPLSPVTPDQTRRGSALSTSEVVARLLESELWDLAGLSQDIRESKDFAVALLNVVREACEPLLEAASQVPAQSEGQEESESESVAKDKPPDKHEKVNPGLKPQDSRPPARKEGLQRKEKPSATYEEAFPSLAAALQRPASNKHPTCKQKKRIAPTRVTVPLAQTLTDNGPESFIDLKPADKDRLLSRLESTSKPSSNLANSPQITVSETQTQEPLSKVKTETRLPDKIVKLAKVHGHLISNRLVPSVLIEVQLMLRLLALPSTLRSKEREESKPLLRTGDEAGAYACMVLEHSGQIAVSLPEQLLASLVSEPALGKHNPTLHDRIVTALAEQRASHSHQLQAYASRPAEAPVQSAPADSRHNFKTQEAQRLYTNREASRDQFCTLLRQLSSAGNESPPWNSAKAHPKYQNKISSSKDGLRENVQAFLGRVLPANYTWLASFFQQQLLQVAFTGETDPEVRGLAGSNSARLHRLHQRLNAPSTSLLMSPSNPTTLLTSPLKSPLLARNLNSPMLRNRRLAVELFKSNTEKEDQSLSVSIERKAFGFCGVLEPYLMFLGEADSHRLNMALMQSIVKEIKELTEGSGGFLGFSEKVLALQTLSYLLGWLVYPPDGLSGVIPLPVDVLSSLERAKEQGRLTLDLPWLLQLLVAMQARGPAAGYTKAFSELQLIYSCAHLHPKDKSFGVSQLSILSQLEAFFSVSGAPWDFLLADNTCTGNSLASIDYTAGLIDTRYIEQCCSLLKEARAVLIEAQQGRSSGLQHRVLRKITPTPPPANPALTWLGVIKDLPGLKEEDPVQLKLQRAFLDSIPSLRRLIDVIVDTSASNAVTVAQAKHTGPAIAIAVTALHESHTDWEGAVDRAIRTALLEAVAFAREHSAACAKKTLLALADPTLPEVTLRTALALVIKASQQAATKKLVAIAPLEMRRKITEESKAALQVKAVAERPKPEQEEPKIQELCAALCDLAKATGDSCSALIEVSSERSKFRNQVSLTSVRLQVRKQLATLILQLEELLKVERGSLNSLAEPAQLQPKEPLVSGSPEKKVLEKDEAEEMEEVKGWGLEQALCRRLQTLTKQLSEVANKDKDHKWPLTSALTSLKEVPKLVKDCMKQ